MLNVSGGVEFTRRTHTIIRSYADQLRAFRRCTPANVFWPGGNEKFRPSIAVPSRFPVVFNHVVPPTPTHPIVELKPSQSRSLGGEPCRNWAAPIVPFHCAVTFPPRLFSKVHGVAVAKPPSAT